MDAIQSVEKRPGRNPILGNKLAFVGRSGVPCRETTCMVNGHYAFVERLDEHYGHVKAVVLFA